MKKEKTKIQSLSFLLYVASFLIIASWWFMAFRPEKSETDHSATNPISISQKLPQKPSTLDFLSNLDRDKLKIALNGNFELMSRMIADWDVDAQILESKGYHGVKRLPRTEYLRGQILGRQLILATVEQREALRCHQRLMSTTDDCDVTFDLQVPYRRFLPQTVVAASYLMALCNPQEIVAIPRNLREFPFLFDKNLLEQFPIQFDRYEAESIYNRMPDVAFVAEYSHPATMQSIRNQGIKLFTMRHFSTYEEITRTLERIGHMIDRPLEAELMKTFMDAAMISIDNRLMALKSPIDESTNPLKVLCVNYYSNFTVPTTRTITGHLLKRLGSHMTLLAKDFIETPSDWSRALDQELLLSLNPDCLIVSTSNEQKVRNQLFGSMGFKELSACKQNRVAFVNEAIQEFPSQYIVLAYYDLYNALIQVQTQ